MKSSSCAARTRDIGAERAEKVTPEGAEERVMHTISMIVPKAFHGVVED